ncbi:MAG TPA: diaminopimelate decarboxylase, partial [Acidimicrobiales bacterium]|nr:diaminopimelate decarboxylase [Acidimicrobiales bacterium]
MDGLPLHLLPVTAAVDAAGRLAVGGCDVLDLAEAHGTPLFVYDEDHLRHACRQAVAAWGEGVAYGS